MTLQSKFTYWLRWLVVLPGAILASLVALFPLHLILYFTFKDNVESYPKLPERTLTPFVVAGVLVWAGSRIAPEFKMATAIVLSSLWIFIVGGLVVLTLVGANWMGSRINFQGGGLGPVMAIVGSIVGLYVVRREQLAG